MRIRQAITRAIADQARTIRIPVHMIETINKVIRTSRYLVQEIGREPTPEEQVGSSSRGSGSGKKPSVYPRLSSSLLEAERGGRRTGRAGILLTVRSGATEVAHAAVYTIVK